MFILVPQNVNSREQEDLIFKEIHWYSSALNKPYDDPNVDSSCDLATCIQKIKMAVVCLSVCVYMCVSDDRWRVVLIGQHPDYIHATNITVRNTYVYTVYTHLHVASLFNLCIIL